MLLEETLFLNILTLDSENFLYARSGLLDMVEGSLLLGLEHVNAVVQSLHIVFDLHSVPAHLLLRKSRWSYERVVPGVSVLEELIRASRRKVFMRIPFVLN